MGCGSPPRSGKLGPPGAHPTPLAPHSAAQGSRTRRDPHPGLHTAAELARLGLELCVPTPSPSPLPGLPKQLDSLWGHPSLLHPRAHESWAGSTHSMAMHSAGGVSGGRGER